MANRVLKALTEREWGWNREEMRKVHIALVESVMWYAASAWMPWLSATNFGRLERAQREALRTVTGLTKTSPTECVYKEAGMTPVRLEAKRRALITYEKLSRGRIGGTSRELVEKKGRRRLAANKGWREQSRDVVEKVYEGGKRDEFRWVRGVPWRSLADADVAIYTALEGRMEEGMTEEEKRELVERTLEERGPVDLNLYTDGSVEGGTVNGGAACVGMFEGEEIVVRKAAGRWCSSYGAEVTALLEAVKVIEDLNVRSVLVCSDSMAALCMLKNGGEQMNGMIGELVERLVSVSARCRVILQWVPAHIGVTGNEWADVVAKEARGEEQKDVCLWFEWVKSRLGQECRYKAKWEGRLARVYEGAYVPMEGSSRRERVLCAQLRAGHCARDIYYKRRMEGLPMGVCDGCGSEVEKDHWLMCECVRGMRVRCGIRGVHDLGRETEVISFIRRAYPKWLE